MQRKEGILRQIIDNLRYGAGGIGLLFYNLNDCMTREGAVRPFLQGVREDAFIFPCRTRAVLRFHFKQNRTEEPQGI